MGHSSNGNIQIGNATILSADVPAANGVVHIVDTFPLLNAAFNTCMVADLEAAGDFGPFNQTKVRAKAARVLCSEHLCFEIALIYQFHKGCRTNHDYVTKEL